MLDQLSNPILGLPRYLKRMIALAVDIGLCVFCTWFALYLRLGEWVALSGAQAPATLASPIIALPIFISFGLYRAIFRYAGRAVITKAAQAVAVYGIIYAAIFTAYGFEGIPRTLGLIQPLLLLIAVVTSRALAGYWLGGGYRTILERNVQPHVLVYGAGVAGRQLAAAIASSKQMQVAGFLDDDKRLHFNALDGLTIFPPAQLEALVRRFAVRDVLLAIPSASQRRKNEIIQLVSQSGVQVRTLPSMVDIASGQIQVSDLRAIEIEDLLSREVVPPDNRLFAKTITGKTVLVTGAGGSIGSELCRQILTAAPSRLLLVELSEYALYNIDGELRAQARAGALQTEIIPLLGSVTDRRRIQCIMDGWQPNTVYHAAAYKHVPLVEHNAIEGVSNNVLGTFCVAEAARACGAEHFVLISTDKAVRPTNVMGASKRLAEMVLQAMARQGGGTCFAMVRFGNVLGSSGSVVPLFRTQIAAGGPITITDRRVTRFFMTIREAAQLVIQAAAMARGGEVFVLEMGEPVRILDLARNMIRLSGRSLSGDGTDDGDIEIVEIGLRPGEKLYEEILIGADPQPTGHPRILKANEAHPDIIVLQPVLAALRTAIEGQQLHDVMEILSKTVPDYAAASSVVDFVGVREHHLKQRAGASPVKIAGAAE